MAKYYTDEKNAQIIIALLKAHNIRKIIASPGTTNIPIIGSMQNDSFFEMYSAADERSAAYLACGLSAESGEPVALSCTGATASRNYLPGLTEAYYRKLPVLAITSSANFASIGHLVPQVIDRSSMQNDVVGLSVTLPIVKDNDDFWECECKVNNALLELKRRGGCPVHINLCTSYAGTFNTKELPAVRVINRITIDDKFPEIPVGKVAVFVGAHKYSTAEQTDALDQFCASYNAIVLCDHTSSYKGKYRILSALACSQDLKNHSMSSSLLPDTVIHIGEVSGDYLSQGGVSAAKQVWRVSEDGEIRDKFRKLQYVFEMPELTFFKQYAKNTNVETDTYLKTWKNYLSELYSKIPELPYSNAWIASQIAHKLPEESTLHLGILNSLRTWNCFEVPKSVKTSSNVGGFGIDGCVSTLIGASFANRDKLYFGVFGDLAFFYDMNSLGNRYLGNNLRILLINNGKGAEFRLYSHIGNQFETQADEYIAAARHYGNKSSKLVQHYAQDLGFEYLTASNKEEFIQVKERFLTSEITEKPIFLEVFTDSSKESDAVEILESFDRDIKSSMKQTIRKLMPKSAIGAIKAIKK